MWQIEARRVTASSKNCSLPISSSEDFDYFEKDFPVLVKSAVSQLGVDPDFHMVSAQTHQLLIYGQGKGVPYIHNFDQASGNYLLVRIVSNLFT